MIPNIYLNLEDDVSTIVGKIKNLRSQSMCLVCPKRCFLFNDSINLRLLKKQADLIKKEVFILTMDEKGQLYAKEAGFQLKYLSKSSAGKNLSDINRSLREKNVSEEEKPIKINESLEDNKGNFIKENFKTLKQAKEKISQKIGIAKGLNLGHTPGVSIADSDFPPEIQKAREVKTHRKWSQKLTIGLTLISLIVVLLIYFVILPKAEVVVYPKTEPLTRDMEISLGVSIKEPDSSRLVLPATKFSNKMEVKGTFQSQGKKEIGNKAKGAIKIYNFTGKPLNLKTGTTILTVGSKNYILTQDVNSLKPTTYKNAKTKEVNENSLGPSFEIIAQDGGESFNLPQGTRVEITNQIFGSNPKSLYAMTDSAITGGTSRFLSLITDADINTSKEDLNNKLASAIADSLAGQNLYLVEKCYTLDNPEFTTDKPVNTESPNFSANLSATATGLAINYEQLFQLVVDRISQSLSQEKVLAGKDQTIVNIKLKTLDLNAETAVLLVHFEGKSVSKVNLNDIGKDLAGKNKNYINEILQTRSDIEKIDVLLAPSWQKNFPWFVNKIQVQKGID